MTSTPLYPRLSAQAFANAAALVPRRVIYMAPPAPWLRAERCDWDCAGLLWLYAVAVCCVDVLRLRLCCA